MSSSPATPQRRVPRLDTLDPATADHIAAHAAELVAGFRPLNEAEVDLLATLLGPSLRRQIAGQPRRRANSSAA